MIAGVVAVVVHVEPLVSGVEVQVRELILELLKQDTNVTLLFGAGVVLVKDFFCLDIDRPDRVQNATHHKGVAHPWFVDAGLPFLLNPKRGLVYLSDDHASAGLLRGEGHPQAGLIGSKVKVLIGHVGVGESGAGFSNHPGLIFHGGEIQFGQPERIVNLIIQGVVTDDVIVPCARPAAL